MNASLRKMERGQREAQEYKCNGSDTDDAERPLKARVPVQQSPDKKSCSRSPWDHKYRIPRKSACLNLVGVHQINTRLGSSLRCCDGRSRLT